MTRPVLVAVGFFIVAIVLWGAWIEGRLLTLERETVRIQALPTGD